MARRSKNYQETAKQLDGTTAYHPSEAIELAKKMTHTRFDETVELHLRMGVDPRNASQQVRGVALLPYGLGKEIKVLVFAQGEAERIAKAAGADFVGSDELVKKIEDGWLDFDTAIATPDMMGKVSKLGKILGRRGLMPNPKSGTVTKEIAAAVQDIKAGRVEFRVDKTAIIHAPLGKVSFSHENLVENARSLIDAVQKAKPATAKGRYLHTVYLCSTMGPGVQVDLVSLEAK